MRQAQNREQLWSALAPWRQAGQRIALVPTMGNLHAGHLALVEAARQHAERVVCSIYVNPAQFGEGEDFARYPRTPEDDLARLQGAGCDLAFLPDDATMYPNGLADASRITASPSLAQQLEGASRPGHFDGVVTVVARLFNLCQPQLAAFGEKDFQQLLVVQRMAEDLGYPVRILAVPTTREADGLALSSRNRYLDEAQRAAASLLSAVLDDTAARVAGGDTPHGELERAAAAALTRGGFRVDYVAVRRAADLQPGARGEASLRVLAAAWLGKTRLIDNRAVPRDGSRA